MTPKKAMEHARQDIAELRASPTYDSCEKMHAAIRGYSHALLDCGLISAAQQKMLMAEADAELRGWELPPTPYGQQPR
ncbi:hypothetical protein [Pseudomonas sp. ME-P-057]|uniref:hypothetical protein n=1 Tax=Pseudomonas sp. ME-P-057 TaxID=3040321 RepID=UPI00255773E5|nr:hypothetical protein [Pseudomonas sp. ME-P-057]